MRALNALARLFHRSDDPHPALAAIMANGIGQPLLVEPAMGERLIAAYMQGAGNAPLPLLADEPRAGSAASRAPGPAVMNISGGLVSRPQPGLCDDGPASYEAIRSAFDSLLADDGVSAIVLRLESPGGMVSGCFDLTDHIHAARGAKPIVAVVDDYAYSAAYAIASACDSIWVSRTGGIGSIGVVIYHVDQTGYNEKVGMKVTQIFAGARKVDFSPHQSLGDEAHQRAQREVNGLQSLFVDSVARYRNLSPARVAATDALTYTGQAAVDVGLADHVGTLRDALASLGARTATTAGRQSHVGGKSMEQMTAELTAVCVAMREHASRVRNSSWDKTTAKFCALAGAETGRQPAPPNRPAADSPLPARPGP